MWYGGGSVCVVFMRGCMLSVESVSVCLYFECVCRVCECVSIF